MLEEIEFDAPLPIDTITMTDEIPMTMPKIVRLERVRFAESAVYVSLMISTVFMMMVFYVRDDTTVFERNDAFGVFSDIVLVGDKYNGAAVFAV